MSEGKPESPALATPESVTPRPLTRRSVLMYIGIAMNAAIGLAVAVPVVGYLLGPIKRKGAYRKWITLGPISNFPAGQTRLADFVNPFKTPQDGETANTPCWVRHIGGSKFQVFAINCAHLNCPVRWFAQSELFMCPCHGGVYYADGSRAAGPPPRGLFEYKYQVIDNELHIDAGQMPTLANEAKLVAISPCGGGDNPCQG